MSGLILPGQKFTVVTRQDVLDDLQARLASTRFPREQLSADWRYGTPLDYARRLRDRWLNGFNWRRWEDRINAFEQRMVRVDGQDIHVLVEEGSGDDPLPLLLTHGWPGSFLEFIDLIAPLAHPERFGGRIEDAFTVVLPSLPGYGFSPAPASPVSPREIAALWSKLAAEHFRFAAYGAQGGDWGSLVTAQLALHHPDRLVAVHLNTSGMAPTLDARAPPMSQSETAWAQRMQAHMAAESGYQTMQGTKPQTLSYAQTDSPIGLACWIIEKFQGWTIPGQADDPPFDMDWLLANVMLYWLNGSNAPSWLYVFLMDQAGLSAPPGAHVAVPAGFTLFPRDLVVPPPRVWLERVFNVQHYRVAEDGGHFPAIENGALMLDEIRAFFRRFRK